MWQKYKIIRITNLLQRQSTSKIEEHRRKQGKGKRLCRCNRVQMICDPKQHSSMCPIQESPLTFWINNCQSFSSSSKNPSEQILSCLSSKEWRAAYRSAFIEALASWWVLLKLVMINDLLHKSVLLLKFWKFCMNSANIFT